MKEIELTQGMVALIDEEDFDRVNQYKWHLSKTHKNKSYCEYQIYDGKGNRVRRYMHRFILNIVDKSIEIDHIDGNGLNNQKQNLRESNRNENMSNRTVNNKNNTSGYRGVYWHKAGNKWMASLQHKGKYVYLGLYEDKDEAAHAFDKKARELFGEFCGKLNFPD